MITTTIVDAARDFAALAPAWRALLGRLGSPEPVMTPTWLLAWWRQFGDADGRRLCALVVEDGPELIGIVPLSRRRVLLRGIIPVRRVELLATGEEEADEICSDYIGAIVARGREEVVARLVARLLRGGALGPWDELYLSSMSGEDPFVPALRLAMGEVGLPACVEQTGLCPYIPLPRSWEDYLRQLRAPDRYMISRAHRELEKWVGKDGYELRRADSAEELAEGRRVLCALHEERWRAIGKPGLFASSRFSSFHEEVMAALLRGVDGQLDLLWLVAAGEPIAAVYNIVFRNKVYFYQSGRRLNLPAPVRPGITIHALAIAQMIRQGRREYDFLNGPTQYKRQLCLATRPLVALRAVAPTLCGRALEAARVTAERAAAEVRRRRSCHGVQA